MGVAYWLVEYESSKREMFLSGGRSPGGELSLLSLGAEPNRSGHVPGPRGNR